MEPSVSQWPQEIFNPELILGSSWGNLFEEKVSPNPFQNLFRRLLPVCLADMMGRGKGKNSVEYGLRVFGPLTWSWFEFLRKL